MSKHSTLQMAVDECQTVLTDKEQRIQHSDIVQTCYGDHTVSYSVGKWPEREANQKRQCSATL